MKRRLQQKEFCRFAHSVSPGFTLLDLMVSVAISAVLMALLLPAIQASRAAARRTTCSDHTRQIGVAVHSHEELHHRYPHGEGELAWEFEILPFVEQSELFTTLKDYVWNGMELDHRLRGVQLPIFQCPSDPELRSWSINYVINAGSTFDYLERNDGFRGEHAISSRDVTDGLSQTVFASEALNLLRERQDRRSCWKTPVPYTAEDELDLFADLCAEMPTGALGVEPDPYRHLKSSSNIYDHIMTPNQPSCHNFQSDLGHSTFSSSSEHRGGVNVLFVDGAVKFVSNGVARKVWRAVGTRNGHESVTLP